MTKKDYLEHLNYQPGFATPNEPERWRDHMTTGIQPEERFMVTVIAFGYANFFKEEAANMLAEKDTMIQRLSDKLSQYERGETK